MSNSLSGPKNLVYAVCIVLFALTGRAHAESTIDISLEGDAKLTLKEQKSNRSLPHSYYDQAIDSIRVLFPDHEIYVKRRHGTINELRYSIVCYKETRTDTRIKIGGAAVEGSTAWFLEATVPEDSLGGNLLLVMETLANLPHSENGQIDLTPRMNVVHKELIEHATKMLERYGTTFYALGRYLNSEGKLGSISPERSARLDPEAIAESLRESFRSGYLSKADVVGIAVDRPGSNKLLVDLEDATGICRSIEQEYESAPNGGIRFQGAKISTCVPKLFPAKDK